jgi:hypothetical protein
MSPDAAGPESCKILHAGGQSDDVDGVFMTDVSITTRSQKEKLVS